MTEPAQKQIPQTSPMRRDHMANERTFLAWIRTSIGIMAFGFVIEKFALFLRHLQFFFKDAQPLHSGGYSTMIGIILVASGALMGFLAFVRYKKVEKEINEDTYQPSLILDILLTLGLLMICIFLVFYMIRAL
jgi:putative membrane protein